MKRFIGIWQNKRGNRLIIKEKNEKEAIVTFISGMTGEPVKRPYFNNQLTIDTVSYTHLTLPTKA